MKALDLSSPDKVNGLEESQEELLLRQEANDEPKERKEGPLGEGGRAEGRSIGGGREGVTSFDDLEGKIQQHKHWQDNSIGHWLEGRTIRIRTTCRS